MTLWLRAHHDHPAKFSGHTQFGHGDIVLLVCHVIL